MELPITPYHERSIIPYPGSPIIPSYGPLPPLTQNNLFNNLMVQAVVDLTPPSPPSPTIIVLQPPPPTIIVLPPSPSKKREICCFGLVCCCGGPKEGCGLHRRYLYGKVCWAAVITLLLLAFSVLFVVWLVLRAPKPKFYLQDLSVLCLNVTPPASTYLFTTMQATVAACNDDDRAGVYYENMDVYAQYKGVAITVPWQLPVEYQGHHDQSVWSPYLRSMDNVVLPPALAVALAQDETAGYVLIDIRIDGWIQWKVGTWISSRHHLQVNCPALLTVNEGKGSYGSNTDGGIGYFRFQQAAACSVDF